MNKLAVTMLSTLLITGCATDTAELRKIDARLSVVEARLYGFDKELTEMNDYLRKKDTWDRNHIEKHNKAVNTLQEQINLHETRIKELMPIYNQH